MFTLSLFFSIFHLLLLQVNSIFFQYSIILLTPTPTLVYPHPNLSLCVHVHIAFLFFNILYLSKKVKYIQPPPYSTPTPTLVNGNLDIDTYAWPNLSLCYRLQALQTKIVYLPPMRKEIWTYMPDPTSDSVTDYRRGRGLADDIGTPAEKLWSHLLKVKLEFEI